MTQTFQYLIEEIRLTAAAFDEFQGINKKEYDRRVWSWAMYDWASSAFSTTILAAVLPIYFSQVAGANLPSPAIATSYWSFGLSLSLFIVAIYLPSSARSLTSFVEGSYSWRSLPVWASLQLLCWSW